MTTALFSLALDDLEATHRFGARLSDCLQAGDVVCLDGPLGAGKTALARAVLQAKMRKNGHVEDVPSPSFTLVQLYEFSDVDVWHTDLYRLNDLAEVEELGLFDAMETSICLIEWPDRLGPAVPKDALFIKFEVEPGSDTRNLTFHGPAFWRARLRSIGMESIDA